MSTDLYKKLQATARAHVAAYCSPNIWDAEKIWALRAPGCEHFLTPVDSLAPRFHGNIDEERHRHFMDFFGPCFADFTADIRWEAVDTENRLVSHGLDCTMDFKAFGDEPALNGYRVQYIWTVWMDKSGQKIIKVEEMVDLPRVIDFASARAARYAAFIKGE